MEAVRSDIFLVANCANQPFLFSKNDVLDTASLLQEEHKKAVLLICEAIKPKQITKNYLQSCFYGFFGALNQRHGLYPNHRLGFSATEPQITKGIVKFLDPVSYGKKGEDRLKVFLRALLDGCSKNESLISSLENAHSFCIQAEKLLPQNKRIDIFIGWNPNLSDSKFEFEYGLIIEVKFGHKIMPRTLPSYEKHAKRILANSDNSLFLLTLDGDPSDENPDWQPVHWLTLMSRWERNIEQETEEDAADFTQFRRFIWKNIGN